MSYSYDCTQGFFKFSGKKKGRSLVVHTTSIEEICLSLCFLQAPMSKVLLGKNPAITFRRTFSRP